MVFELASAQRRLGADVEIWTPNALRAGSTEIFDELPVRYFSANPLFGLARSFRLRQEIATLPKDAILHAHNTFNPLNLQVGAAAAENGLKVFYHPHGALDPALFPDWSPKSLKKRLYIRVASGPNLNKSAGVFALTPLERNQLLSLGITAPIHVVPNGIRPVTVASPEQGLALRRQHGLDPADRVMLFIGRITPKKRLEDIIEALSLLGASAPTCSSRARPQPSPTMARHSSALCAPAVARRACTGSASSTKPPRPRPMRRRMSSSTLPNRRAWPSLSLRPCRLVCRSWPRAGAI